MKTMLDLRNLLKQIDHRGYPAYKETKGSYQFQNYVLTIEQVQGDPFAAPSKVKIVVPGKQNRFSNRYYALPWKRTALSDLILRRFAQEIARESFRAKGSGKSGLLAVTVPGQEILEHSACEICPEDGTLTVRMVIGFPANGRTILSGELVRILFEFLPHCVEKSLFAAAYKKEELEDCMRLSSDQHKIREELKKRDLCAFIADGSILPRKSGVSQKPLKDAVPFVSPKHLRVTIDLEEGRTITGMGIPRGITLLVGGGYHGKSTVLDALSMGIYNHIGGDGREYVLTDSTAVKLRAEDGRSVQKDDISMFIRNLPNKKDTTCFSSENASGSTSQAANTVEAMESYAKVFLVDEDTSATNFMIRDELMQRVVHRDQEPILPFIDRIRELYERYGISMILVVGSNGSYFHKADLILQMDQYVPVDITEYARKEAKAFPLPGESPAVAPLPDFHRVVKRDPEFIRAERIRIHTHGLEGFSINREDVDLRYVEQLSAEGQVEALAFMIRELKQQEFDSEKTLREAIDSLWERIEEKGFLAYAGKGVLPGSLVWVRKQELFAACNRCRKLLEFKS